jgi:sec-independent protein translocase protein TatB
MFGISFTELLLILLVTIFLIKPSDLPKIIRSISDFILKIRDFKNDVTSLIEEVSSDITKSSDLDLIKKNLEDFKNSNDLKEIFSYRGRNYLLDLDGNVRELFDLNKNKSSASKVDQQEDHNE